MKKKKIYYWSPFISKIATVKAVLNSAKALEKYSRNELDVRIINSFGEFSSKNDNGLQKISLLKKNYSTFFSDKGFLKSRISWIIIIIMTFIPLLNLLKKEKPDYLIIHLLTISPLIINFFFNIKTKIILRISGLPKLNFIRKFFWKMCLPKIYALTCPTKATKKDIESLKLLSKEKVFYLADPVIEMKNLLRAKKDKIKINCNYKKYIFAAGRLTKQKNFVFLINSFSEIKKKYSDLNLIIAGEGEQKKLLENLILKKKLNQCVKLIGHSKKTFELMKNSLCFVCTSLWEDPGFVLVEAVSSRTLVISSSCKNGPKEILLNGDGGYIFKSNDKNDFLKQFDNLMEEHNNDPDTIYKKKLNAFKNIKLYSKYSHFKNFMKIL